MLLPVVAVAIPPAWWTWRILTDEAHFADAVAALPHHRLVRRAIGRRMPVVDLLAGGVLSSPMFDRLWRHTATIGHRRLRRATHRAAFVVVAAAATLSTPHGRWRALAWLTGSLTVATTLRLIS